MLFLFWDGRVLIAIHTCLSLYFFLLARVIGTPFDMSYHSQVLIAIFTATSISALITTHAHTCRYTHIYTYTSSTAQGGGGSFKNRKPIGEVGCCESGMAERSHWLTERCLRSPLFCSLSLTIYLPTYLSIYLSISLSFSSNYLSSYLSIYLSISPSIDLLLL